MNISEQLLSALSIYGLPVLFGVIIIASAGIPMPMSLLLVAAGSFVEQGEMKLWQVIVLASTGAVIGDQIGYGIGRWGGRKYAFKISRWFNTGEKNLKRAEAATRKWEGMGVFFSRWLITPLGPWLNLTSGFTEYPWHRFLLWDVLGEVLWVLIFVNLGRIFSDRVQAMSEVLGNLAWVAVGLIVAVFCGWKLYKSFKSSRSREGESGNRDSSASTPFSTQPAAPPAED
jgi:membrane protein DedA with SNARE-associated domain